MNAPEYSRTLRDLDTDAQWMRHLEFVSGTGEFAPACTHTRCTRGRCDACGVLVAPRRLDIRRNAHRRRYGAAARLVRVFLDGVEQKYAIMYDVALGLVVRLKLAADGRPLWTNDDDPYADTEKAYGVVTLEMRDE